MTRRANPETSDVMPKSHSTARIIPVAVIVGLLLTLHLYSPPRIGLWANVFYDSLHVPVFGLIAISIYSILIGRLAWKVCLLVAFAGACALGRTAQVDPAQSIARPDGPIGSVPDRCTWPPPRHRCHHQVGEDLDMFCPRGVRGTSLSAPSLTLLMSSYPTPSQRAYQNQYRLSSL